MLNLLFIVSNPKSGPVRKLLQPRVKARIDAVADFDHGLKVVFEIRPAVVVIQEQIAGVSGDSVARHIQMLLGSGAPSFILAHEGSGVPKTVKGLFDHIVDLNKNEAELADDIISVLHAILGDRSDSVIIPDSMASLEESQPATVASPATATPADQLVDDFLATLEKAEQSDVPAEKEEAVAGKGADEQALPIVSTADEMASLLIDAARKAAEQPGAAEEPPEQATVPVAAAKEPSSEVLAPAHAVNRQKAAPVPHPQVSAAKPATVIPPVAAPVAGTAAVSHRAAETVPEDLLQAFENNYNSCASSWKKKVGAAVACAVVVILGGGAWYLRTHNPELLSFGGGGSPQTAPRGGAISTGQQTKTADTKSDAGKAAGVAGTAKADKSKAAAEVPASTGIPAFARSARPDRQYSAKKPGWERYVGNGYDVRIFRADNRIKAVQVIAAKGVVDGKYLDSVLAEVAGSSKFTLGERERKAGYREYLIQRGTMNDKADLVLYRSRKTDAVSAFVVSLN